MKLFYSPGACSLGIHVLLHEVGQKFDLQKVDTLRGQQFEPEYTAVNSKSKVPALLRDDGILITEFPAIAFYLARAYPGAALLPPGLDSEIKALEWLDYLVATVHMRGFTRIFRPASFAPTEADHEQVRQEGRDIAAKGFALLADQLGKQKFVLGGFSIVDAAVFFLELWAVRRAGVTLPSPLQAHFERMQERPAVRLALAAEGLG